MHMDVFMSREHRMCEATAGTTLYRNIITAFLRMDALMSREHMDVRSDRGDDGASY